MDLEEEVKEYFKDLIECPVCFETIDFIPIYQCQNGHVVCKNCYPKLKKCPICRQIHDGPIRNLKLEEMVEKLQLSLSEGTKKLASESIQINPIVPETPNLHWNTNQETKKAMVQLDIVEDDENVTSEPSCANFLNLLVTFIIYFISFILASIISIVFWSMIGGYVYLSGYMLSLQTTASEIFGCILLAVFFAVVVLVALCAGAKASEP